MATTFFGLPINSLDNFEAERAAQDWNGFPVPLVAHDYAVQIAEAVGDPIPEPYEGLRPYDGLCWQVLCRDCGMAHSAEHACEPITWTYDEPPTTSIESQVYIDGGVEALRAYRREAVCPDCGAVLDLEEHAVINEPVLTDGGRIARRSRPCVAAFCPRCEFCVEVRRERRA